MPGIQQLSKDSSVGVIKPCSTTLSAHTRASTGSPRQPLQHAPTRGIRRADSAYERGHVGGRVSPYPDLPEEFWTDFDDIVWLLPASIAATEARVAEVAAWIAHLSDKESGLSLNSLPADARPYLFGFRKSGAITGKSRESLMRSIRPTGNVLAGYVPSYAMGRVLQDATS